MPNLKRMPDMDKIMTSEEVATYLKITPRTLYRMLEENQIPAFKIRSAWRSLKDEIEAVMHDELPQKGGK